LLVKGLEHIRTLKHIRSYIGRLPRELDEIYDDFGRRIAGQDTESVSLAKNVFCWITQSRRALTTRELQHALAVEEGAKDLDEDNLVEVHDILSVYSGLVIVQPESGIIQPFHYTYQEYLERNLSSWFPGLSGDKLIATTCLGYLSYDAFLSGPAESSEALQDRLKSYPLLSYAAKYWGEHIRYLQYQSSDGDKFRDRTLELLSNEPRLSSIIQAMHCEGKLYKFPRRVSALHIAAYFGLNFVVKGLLDSILESQIDTGSDYYGTAIQAAAMGGWESVVALLLERGANPDSAGGEYDGPLQAAASKGHLLTVMKLVNSGADVDRQVMGGRGALHHAADHGHDTIVKALLEHGADINSRDREFGRTALAWASLSGHEAVVRILLDCHPNMDVLDDQKSTALHLALEQHNDRIIDLLIDEGAKLDVVNSNHKTAVDLALETIRRIEPSDFEPDVNLTRNIESGTQATVEVLKIKENQESNQVSSHISLRMIVDESCCAQC
jgi:ankyrin repeat protein